MMDVSGTDPRTRTGLFLWPWASYPAVAANAAVGAAHAQPIMMGASAATNATAMNATVPGSNMLGVSHPAAAAAAAAATAGNPGSTTLPGMIEDPFESFCQRFSYSGAAHAAHMSHILPHQHVGLNDTTRHLAQQDHEAGESETSRHLNHSPSMINHARAHITSSQRLLAGQPRGGGGVTGNNNNGANHIHSHTTNNTNGHNDQLSDTCNTTNNHNNNSTHAAAIAAFASAAASSAIMGANESNIGHSNGLALPHGIQVPRHVQQGLRNPGANDMVLDGLCNGFAKPSQFSSVTNALNRQQSAAAAAALSPRQITSMNCGKLQADSITSYNLHCHHFKSLGNPAAVALAAAAVVGGGGGGACGGGGVPNAGDHLHFPSALNNELRENMTPTNNNNKQHVDETNSSGNTNNNGNSGGTRGSHSSNNNDNYSLAHGQQTQQQQYIFSPKSPLSDSLENTVETDRLTGKSSTRSRGDNNIENKTMVNRLLSSMPQQADRLNNLIFRNTNLRGVECSPDSSVNGTGRRSTDLLMEDPLTTPREDNNGNNNNTTNNNSNNNGNNSGSSNNSRVESRFLGINQDDGISINGLCNGENGLSSILGSTLPSTGHNTTTSYHHPPAKGYKCKICQHVCFSRHDLSAHNAATHKQDPRPYRCEQCGRQFSTCAYLSQHRRIHTGVKPYACRYCDRRFTQLSHVQQHERIHTGEKPYRCTTCMKSFTQMSNLQSHQRQHMKGKPFRCEQCFMSFDTKEELDVHVQAKHSGNRYAKVLVCPICTKSYNSETYLAKHVDRHKEAAATAGADGNGSNTRGNNSHNSNNNSNNNNNNNNTTNNTNSSSNNNNTSVINLRNQTCMDNIFAAGFHNHSVAMAAAAASALTRGGQVIDSNAAAAVTHMGGLGGVTTGGRHPHGAAAAAAAMVAAHAHQDLHLRAVAAAAVANSNTNANNNNNGMNLNNHRVVGVGGDIDNSCGFFNSTLNDARINGNNNNNNTNNSNSNSPNTGCDLLHNNNNNNNNNNNGNGNALNYSSMSTTSVGGLFHHLPVGGMIHGSSSEHLTAAVQQQQQQCITSSHRHQHFQEESHQHMNSYGHSNLSSPNHHNQSQQQQQQQLYGHQHHPHHHQPQQQLPQGQQHIQVNQRTNNTTTLPHSSSKRHSTSIKSTASPSSSSSSASSSLSPGVNDSSQCQQHLLNLTQHRLSNSTTTTSKRICSPSTECTAISSSSSVSSVTIAPTGGMVNSTMDRYISTPITTSTTSITPSPTTGTTQSVTAVNGSLNNEGIHRHALLPPPAHQQHSVQLGESNSLYINNNNNNNDNQTNCTTANHHPTVQSETQRQHTHPHHHQNHHQEEHIPLPVQNHSSQSLLSSHVVGQLTSSPCTSPSQLLNTTDDITIEANECQRMNIKEDSHENCEKWYNDRHNDNTDDVLNAYNNDNNEEGNKKNPIEIDTEINTDAIKHHHPNRGKNQEEQEEEEEVDDDGGEDENENEDDIIMNKTDISTPNHMYDFLFHANSNSNNNDDDDVGLKSTQHEDVDEDPKDLLISSHKSSRFNQNAILPNSLSPTSTDLLQCNNNNNGGNILHNRSISSASASLSSSSSSSPCIDPVMTDEINSIGLENINYTDNNHDNNNTNNNPTECETNTLSTSIGIESILGGGDHPLKIQTNNQYTMDKLKSIDAGNLFPSNNNNNNNHNINPNNTNNRSLKRSWSNRELLNAYNNHDPDHQDDGNDDHSIDHNDNNDIHNDIDTDSIDCVGIRSLSDDNSTINVGNPPQIP
uniref:C2H2-type domain-containing protein n=1 Tax=Trichobilharzia regenti TaxID=157069 RepID=A0AA85K3L0_TRIRE|nr:unnamed protein product [Trichobilharzia regenti]